jgi:xylose isomerase
MSSSSSSKPSNGEYFPGIARIEYDPEAPKDKHLCFRHYNPTEQVLGRTMSDWLRFAVCYWHTFRWMGNDPFGTFTLKRDWDDGSQSVENAKRRINAAFEFFHKLQVKHWTFHDRDIAPEGADLKETEKNLDEVVDEAVKLQAKYGIKALWGTANLFSNPRYMSGAATNPDFHVFAYAAAQVKKAMDVTAKLGGENYVFWGGREGFSTLLNTNVRAELDHYAALLRMSAQYKKKMGYNFQLLIEPKAREPTAHQYDYDAQTVIGFLKFYGLENDFKLNIEPNH